MLLIRYPATGIARRPPRGRICCWCRSGRQSKRRASQGRVIGSVIANMIGAGPLSSPNPWGGKNWKLENHMRSEIDLTHELETEAGNFTEVALVVGFEHTTIFIFASDAKRLEKLADAMNGVATPWASSATARMTAC